MTIATGKPMLASDMLNLVFFPKGAILMYDGTSWQDNVTLKGWYKCEGQMVDGYGVLPDLKNRFVIGYDSASTPQRSKDNNSVTASGSGALSVANLPRHNHSFKNEIITTGSGGGHSHTFEANSRVQLGNDNGVSYGVYPAGGIIFNTSSVSAHTHTFNLDGKTTNDTGSATPFSISVNFDNRPSYYALIYIIKVTEAGS